MEKKRSLYTILTFMKGLVNDFMSMNELMLVFHATIYGALADDVGCIQRLMVFGVHACVVERIQRQDAEHIARTQ